MTDLVDAYQHDDIHRYENILQNNKDVLADPFIAENIDEVTRNMRTKGVLKLIAPYTRFNMAFIAKHLKISVAEVQDIVGFLIVDGKLKGKINQEKGTVEVENDEDVGRTQSIQQWTSAIDSLWRTILDEGEGFKADESQGLGGSMFPSLPAPRLEGMGLPGLQKGMNGTGKKMTGKKGGPEVCQLLNEDAQDREIVRSRERARLLGNQGRSNQTRLCTPHLRKGKESLRFGPLLPAASCKVGMELASIIEASHGPFYKWRRGRSKLDSNKGIQRVRKH